VSDMPRAAREGSLDGCEVFFYTDNQTTDGSYFRGTAKSRALFEIIVTLYKLQMQLDFILHVVWIARAHIIQHGTDGLSMGRGQWSSHRWNVFGRNVSSKPQRDSTESDASACQRPVGKPMFLRGVTRISFNHPTCHILSRLSPISYFLLVIYTSCHHLESSSGTYK
jgi:hypothetical protein